MEALRLRIKDIDFTLSEITVREGKGDKDRVTVLPQTLKHSLTQQLQRVKLLHQKDLREGYGSVSLPSALERKYRNASRDWTGNLFSLDETFSRSSHRNRTTASHFAGRFASCRQTSDQIGWHNQAR
jgi:integrase